MISGRGGGTCWASSQPTREGWSWWAATDGITASVGGDTRAEAILRMRRSLNEYRIGGIRTSIPFHQELMDSPEFMWGTFDTGFLSRRRLSARHPHSEEHEKLAAVVAAMIAHEEGRHAVARVGKGDNGSLHSGSLWKQSGRMRAQRGRW